MGTLSDNEKTKDQLIEELVVLRGQVTTLAAESAADEQQQRRTIALLR